MTANGLSTYELFVKNSTFSLHKFKFPLVLSFFGKEVPLFMKKSLSHFKGFEVTFEGTLCGTLQVWDFGGSGLRRVRILKNDISFAILMISVSF